MSNDQNTNETLEILEAVLARVDRIDDWTYKMFMWVRGAIIGVSALGVLLLVASLAAG